MQGYQIHGTLWPSYGNLTFCPRNLAQSPYAEVVFARNTYRKQRSLLHTIHVTCLLAITGRTTFAGDKEKCSVTMFILANEPPNHCQMSSSSRFILV